MKKLKTFEEYRDGVAKAMRRKMDAAREDRLNTLIVDALADLMIAAHLDGFTREEIDDAVRLGAGHCWADIDDAEQLRRIEQEEAGAA